MKFVSSVAVVACALLTAEVVTAVPRIQITSRDSNLSKRQNGNDKVLLDANVQDASASTGQNGVPAPGQSNSLTDDANFINFCTGKTLTNGLQVQAGSCNGIVMGEIPSVDKMVSTIIISPKSGETIGVNTTFTISVRTNNLDAGSFTNPKDTYYAAPQKLNDQGVIIGHTHVTIQPIDDENGQPPRPDSFAFFKGINNKANANGLLTADVAGGLEAGSYRLCTMTSSSNHQPVLMPVAQRGAQDDCIRFTVKGNGSDGNGDAGADGNGDGAGDDNTSTTSSDSATATATSNASDATSTDGATATTDAPTATGATGANVQTFTGTLGVAAPAVTNAGGSRPFVVNGNSFLNFGTACQRSCDIQFNGCANAANAGGQSFTVGNCGTQAGACSQSCFSTPSNAGSSSNGDNSANVSPASTTTNSDNSGNTNTGVSSSGVLAPGSASNSTLLVGGNTIHKRECKSSIKRNNKRRNLVEAGFY